MNDEMAEASVAATFHITVRANTAFNPASLSCGPRREQAGSTEAKKLVENCGAVI